MVALATFSTALAWPLLFQLVAADRADGLEHGDLLAPAFGIVWGALVLGEPLGPSLLLGAALILTSVALIVGLDPSGHRDRVSWIGCGQPLQER